MRFQSRSAGTTGALRRTVRSSIVRVASVAGAIVLAACATPPAEEPATTSAAAAPVASASAAPAAVASADAATVADTVSMTVYKQPTCGCCAKWVEHVEQHGMRVDARDVADVWPIKQQLGVPSHLGSCHTAVIGGYVVEGHVPADIIKRMLRERPQIAGIAVAGMPIGSPGMEGDGSHRERYDVIAIGRDGRTSVYATR
jgi:hypothetical protein